MGRVQLKSTRGDVRPTSGIHVPTPYALVAMGLAIVLLVMGGAQKAWAADDTFAADYADSARGTEQAPYRISTEQDLREFAKVVNGAEPVDGAWSSSESGADDMAGRYVSLEEDITITEAAVPVGIGSNATTSEELAAVCFSGTFLGNNHTIRNWYTSAEANPTFGETSMDIATTKHSAGFYSAPFGAISAATINDLNVTLKSGVSYTASNIGGLVAFVGKGASSIERCSVSGDIEVTGDHVGGLVGSYCTDYGSVGTAQLSIARCFHNGSVKITGAAAGGIMGYIGAAGVSVSESYQYGNVSSTKTGTQYYPNENYWGSILGSGGSYSTALTGCVSSQDAQIYPSNATRVTSAQCLSGISDWAADEVRSALGGNDGAFDFDATEDGSVPPPLKADAVTKLSHSVVFLRGADDVTGVVPTSTAAVEGEIISLPDIGSGSTELARNGYSFIGWLRTDSDADTAIYQPGTAFEMPDCKVEFTAQWSAKDPVLFSTEDQLRDFALGVNAGTIETKGNVYALGADIDLAQEFIPIGNLNHPFEGVFYGNGCVVRNLVVTDETAVGSDSAKYAGLFGCVLGARIEGVGVECAIDASGCEGAGGLVGHASGTCSTSTGDNLTRISNCYVRGTVKGGVYIGGLVGSATYTTVESCYAQGAATCAGSGTKNAVGGLVGTLVLAAAHTLDAGESILSNSYAACEVLAVGGTASKGALVGRAYSVYDASLCEESQWPAISNAWVLESSVPVYTFGAVSAEAVGTPVTEAVSEGMRMDAQALSEAASTLGASFKADATSSLLQLNEGYPVLAWEVPLKASKIQLFVSPLSASVSLVDESTNNVVEPSSTTEVASDDKTLRAYAFTTVASHAYTATIELDGYETKVESFSASEEAVSRTIELAYATYTIRYEKSNARWADGFVPTMTYTIVSDEVILPSADDMVWDGYRFLGWHAARDFSDDAIEAVSTGSTGNKVFYAKWENIAAAERQKACTAAEEAIAKADSVLSGYAISIDGSDVDANALWVTAEAAAAVQQAKTALQNVLDDDQATTDEITSASELLSSSLDALASSAAKGTKSTASDSSDGNSTGGSTSADETASGSGSQVTIKSPVSKGGKYVVGGMTYKVTKVATAKSAGAVTLVKAKNAKKVTVPATVKLADGLRYKVKVIAKGAFKKLAKVRTVVIGKNVATIKARAFYGMKKLTNVTVGVGVKKIGASAFYNTPKLAKITVKSKQLTKARVKGALKGSKIRKALTVKVRSSMKAKYKKAFTKKNLKSPVKVSVK